MQAFPQLRSRLVALPAPNIDTDQILPADFMKGLTRDGLGAHLFARVRCRADGTPDPDFPLNRAENAGAQILLAGANFGCGSSREHAVWALADAGFRCIIAPSFGMIFAGNCARNGLLLVAPDAAQLPRIAACAGSEITVDLAACAITLPDGARLQFEVDQRTRARLLSGQDDIARTLTHESEIAAFEAADRQSAI